MKALLDTNIIIHREANKIVSAFKCSILPLPAKNT